MSNQYGLSFGIFGGHSLEDTIAMVKSAEKAGLEACWIFEDYFYLCITLPSRSLWPI